MPLQKHYCLLEFNVLSEQGKFDPSRWDFNTLLDLHPEESVKVLLSTQRPYTDIKNFARNILAGDCGQQYFTLGLQSMKAFHTHLIQGDNSLKCPLTIQEIQDDKIGSITHDLLDQQLPQDEIDLNVEAFSRGMKHIILDNLSFFVERDMQLAKLHSQEENKF